MSDIVLELTISSPIELDFNCFDIVTWLNSLPVCDSDESAAIEGVALNGWYLTAYNHTEATGGVLKKRLS